MANTVIEYRYVQFDDHWTTIVAEIVQYTATDDVAEVIVVTEGALAQTYWFQVKKGAVVMVPIHKNIIYIPARCLKKTQGDQTTCGG
jgi:hypothetical protein